MAVDDDDDDDAELVIWCDGSDDQRTDVIPVVPHKAVAEVSK